MIDKTGVLIAGLVGMIALVVDWYVNMREKKMPSTKPRQFTEQEVRDKFLELVWSYISYWQELPDKTCNEKVEGLAFSILVILDGESELPAFIVAPDPHPSDKKYLKGKGLNWFPENHRARVACDISGGLHDLFHTIGKQLAQEENSE